MPKIKDIISFFNDWAHPSWQESYDNARLITGNSEAEVKGVLITLDCIEAVVDEAIAHNCNLIVAHHPIVFSGLKSLTGKNYIERTIIKAIRHDIAIFAIHTNLDNIATGVNYKIAQKIGLQNCRILAPKSHTLAKLTLFVPTEYTEKMLTALSQAGAGKIGNYSECSFVVNGNGTFKPNEKAKPSIGKNNKLERVNEDRIEVIFPHHAKQQVLNAMKETHPYEEVAYYLHQLENENQEIGSGMYGELESPMDEKTFMQLLKTSMNLTCIKHTRFLGREIRHVALCGGSGSFLLPQAKQSGADIFITADFKYHQYFDADDQLIIADIGHYESEVFTKELIYDKLNKIFTNIALRLSMVETNPVNYIL